MIRILGFHRLRSSTFPKILSVDAWIFFGITIRILEHLWCLEAHRLRQASFGTGLSRLLLAILLSGPSWLVAQNLAEKATKTAKRCQRSWPVAFGSVRNNRHGQKLASSMPLGMTLQTSGMFLEIKNVCFQRNASAARALKTMRKNRQQKSLYSF